MAETTHSAHFARASSQKGTVAPAAHTNVGTFEMWIMPDFDPGGTTEYFIIDGTAGATRFLFYKNGFADCYGLYIGGGAMADGAGANLNWLDNAGEWVHIAVAWNSALSGSERCILYKNGVEHLKNDADPAGAMPATLYVGSNNSSTNFFDGNLDDIRFWSDVRTPAEILANYCVSDPADTTGLVDHWKLDNDWTNEVGNDISPVNTPTFETDVHASCGVAGTNHLSLLGVG